MNARELINNLTNSRTELEQAEARLALEKAIENLERVSGYSIDDCDDTEYTPEESLEELETLSSASKNVISPAEMMRAIISLGVI